MKGRRGQRKEESADKRKRLTEKGERRRKKEEGRREKEEGRRERVPVPSVGRTSSLLVRGLRMFWMRSLPDGPTRWNGSEGGTGQDGGRTGLRRAADRSAQTRCHCGLCGGGEVRATTGGQRAVLMGCLVGATSAGTSRPRAEATGRSSRHRRPRHGHQTQAVLAKSAGRTAGTKHDRNHKFYAQFCFVNVAFTVYPECREMSIDQ